MERKLTFHLVRRSQDKDHVGRCRRCQSSLNFGTDSNVPFTRWDFSCKGRDRTLGSHSIDRRCTTSSDLVSGTNHQRNTFGHVVMFCVNSFTNRDSLEGSKECLGNKVSGQICSHLGSTREQNHGVIVDFLRTVFPNLFV